VGIGCAYSWHRRIAAQDYEGNGEDDPERRGTEIHHGPVLEGQPHDQRSEDEDAAEDKHDSESPRDQPKLPPKTTRADGEDAHRHRSDDRQTQHESPHSVAVHDDVP
jgi:hypothetical protein